MKIYPSKHTITIKDEVDLNEEIPIAYINSQYEEETVNINIREEFKYDETKEILPYTSFKTSNEKYPEITLYTDDGAIDKKTQNSLFLRLNDEYVYTPNASITFKPLTFSYNVLAKKNIKYTSSRSFNIRMGCNEEEIANTLIQYFADKIEGNLFPSNIRFNNGDLKIESLIDISLKEADFFFINSEDGKHYENGETINMEDFFSYQTIPFLICETLDGINVSDKSLTKTFKIKESVAMNSVELKTSDYFELITEHNGSIQYHNIFENEEKYSPIIIEEHINKGFIIYCNKNFMNEIKDYYSIFYEVLFYTFFNGYISTPTIYEWISDEMPDFIVQSGRLTQKDKFTSHVELHKLLSLYENDASPIEVKVNAPKVFLSQLYPDSSEGTPIVYYTGMSSDYLIFKKIKTPEYSDPIKNPNQISIYTEKKNIIYFDNFVYSIKENIENRISYYIENENLILSVSPFKNTDLDTYTFNNTIILKYKINNIDRQSFSLAWNNSLKTLEIITDFNNSEYTILADINIVKSNKTTKLYDMRKRGGGLNDDEKDNFDCLDISNILGKSYRKGGSLIATIRLPLKYKEDENKIKDIIYNELSKYTIAEDMLIINLDFE